jgi:hypothetical protein
MSCSMSRTVMPRSWMRADEADQLLGLLVVHAAGRLVEDDAVSVWWPGPGRSPGGAGYRRTDSWPAVPPLSPRPTKASSAMAWRKASAPPAAGPGCETGSRTGAGAHAAVTAGQHVLHHRSCSGTGGWSGRCGRCPASTMVWGAGRPRFCSVEEHRALVRPVVAGDQVEHRGLAGAVRTDQADHAAFASTEKETRLTAVRPPKRLVMWSRLSRVICDSPPEEGSRGHNSAAGAAACPGSCRSS